MHYPGRLEFPRIITTTALVLLLAGPDCATADSVENVALAQLDFRTVVKAAKEKVFPTVVFIKCVRAGMEEGERKAQSVAGSGVLISDKGEVLSNWHVVERATEVRCLLQDGRAFNARVVGADKDVDISLLQLELPPSTPALPFARLGNSATLTEGDFVMAMGAPFGLARSVSIGIISCTKRYLPAASEYSSWLQTDASISPGNSGGPLVNTHGEVIGINTRGMASGGGDTGFAVPIEVAREVADRIRAHGRMDWSWTGLQLQPLKDFDRNIYFPENEGVMVAETDPGSPARRAGIQHGDRIVKLNGSRITGLTQEDIPTVNRRLGLLPQDQPATLELIRQGNSVTVEFTPRAKGRTEGEQLDLPRWDFTVKAINRFDTPDLFFQRSEGVFVFGIKVPGNAAQSGLLQRDIIVKIEQSDIKTLAEIKAVHTEAIARVQTKPRMVLTVLRNGELRQVVLNFAREHQRE
jgi:S1-C subfamily serine protease